MFEKLKAAFTPTPRQLNFDPRCFRDPVAVHTHWYPAASGGTNFRTRCLKAISSDCLAFKPSLGAMLFALIFGLIGGALFLFMLVVLILSGKPSAEILLPMLFGVLFAGGGGLIWRHMTKPIVFDRARGSFWVGHGASEQNLPLQQIHALQMVSEFCTSRSSSFDDDHSRSSSYYSYELNLILPNGQRINVIDHGNYNALREDAETLASFLKRPLWDACGATLNQ